MIEDFDLYKKIERQVKALNKSLVFIHSNIQQGFSIPIEHPFNRNIFLNKHFTILQNLFEGADLWFPTFNYSYSNKRLFNINNDPSEVGHLTEFIRKNISNWRTSVPVFSITGTGEEPEINYTKRIDPFGKESIFQKLIEQDGIVFNYGCDLDKLTFIHYIESITPNLLYRYNKNFDGFVINKNGKFSVECSFHVRPKGINLQYDWDKLKAEITNEGILIPIEYNNRLFDLIKLRELKEFWGAKINENALYFLTSETQELIKPMLQKLGRGFIITDFE